MKLHDMDSFRRNRAVRGHAGCLVHSVHRILFMPGDNDFGVFRRDLRVYGLRTGTRQFQSRIVHVKSFMSSLSSIHFTPSIILLTKGTNYPQTTY